MASKPCPMSSTKPKDITKPEDITEPEGVDVARIANGTARFGEGASCRRKEKIGEQKERTKAKDGRNTKRLRRGRLSQ